MPIELPGSLAFRNRQVPEVDVGTGDGFVAQAQQYNELWGALAHAQGFPGKPTEEEDEQYAAGLFNPLDMNLGSPYQGLEQLQEIATAKNQRELNWKYANFDRENKNIETISNMGTWQNVWTSVVAGGTDPLTLAAIVAWPTLPTAIGARIASSAALGAVSMALPEVVLHAVQTERTLEESMMYTAGGAVMGGIFGPLGRIKTPPASDATKKGVHDLLTGGDPLVRGTTADYVSGGGSVGAMKVEKTARIPAGFRQEIDKKVLAGEMSNVEAAKALRDKELEWTQVKYPRLSRVLAFFSPSVRLATSPFTSTRFMGEEILEDSLVRQANAYGHTTSGYAVETIAGTQIQPIRVAVNNALRSNYQAYVGKRSMTKFAPESIQAKKRGIMTSDEFNDQVGIAMRDGDTHANPHVQAAAKALRAEVAVIEKQLLDEGMIPQRMDEIDVEVPAMVKPDEAQGELKLKGGTELETKTVKQKVPSGEAKVPTGDKSYLPRVWNQQAIVRNFAEFRAALIKHLTKDMDGEALVKFNDPAHMLEVNAYLDDLVRKILGRPLARMDKNIVPQTKFLKSRTINIASNDVKEFLVSDPKAIWYAWARDMIPRIEMQRKFGNYDLSDQLAALDKEVAGMLKVAKNEKERVKINKQYMSARRDVEAARDMVLHRFGNPNDPTSWFVNVGRGMRTWNAVTSLGGMTLAAIPDIGIIATRMGLGRTIKGASLVGQRMGKQGFSKTFLNKIGGALDVTLNNRHQAMMMMDEASIGGHATEGLVRNFSTLTGMAHWNSAMQQIVGLTMIDDLGGMALRKSMPSAHQMQRMAQVYNIDKKMWMRIKKEWKEFGIVDGGLRVPEFAKWTDQEAARVLQASLYKEMRTAVVFPGMGDLPLASRTEIGKMLFQFKSFPLAATSRFMLSTIQNASLAPVNTAAGTLAVAMPLALVSYYVKMAAAGIEPSDDPNVLAREMIDRSGLFGIYTDLNALTEKMTRGQLGLMRILGGEPLSRRASQSVIGDVLGPSFGKFGDTAASVGAISDLIAGEQVSEGDIRRLRRLIPYQNLFWMRDTLNQVEGSIYEGMK